jgi:hypothetical protein
LQITTSGVPCEAIQWLPQEASVVSVEPSSEAGEVAVNHREAGRWYIGPNS